MNCLLKIIKVFLPYEFEEDLKKMSNVGTFAKNVYCCVEHIDRFKKFKEMKEKFRKIINEEISIGTSSKTNSNKDKIMDKTEFENSNKFFKLNYFTF
jgi:hypothetical protein